MEADNEPPMVAFQRGADRQKIGRGSGPPQDRPLILLNKHRELASQLSLILPTACIAMTYAVQPASMHVLGCSAPCFCTPDIHQNSRLRTRQPVVCYSVSSRPL